MFPIIENDHWQLIIKYLCCFIFLSSKNRVSFSGESEPMSNDTPSPGPRRRSSTLTIPEGKPTFSQPLENELFIKEDDQLTYEYFLVCFFFEYSHLEIF